MVYRDFLLRIDLLLFTLQGGRSNNVASFHCANHIQIKGSNVMANKLSNNILKNNQVAYFKMS